MSFDAAPTPSAGRPATHAATRPSQTELVASFRALQVPGAPLLLPNPWDVGSARVLTTLGFEALATTSSGYAATLGRADGAVSRDEAVVHAAAIAAAVQVPVSADLEDGFGAAPDAVAQTVTRARAAGLAGCSIEDATGDRDRPVHEFGAAVDRIRAAVEAADGAIVLTARAENHLYGHADLADTIRRLQAYQEAGADVLYAPGLVDEADIRAVVSSVDRPVNVLALPGVPDVPRLAELGVARVSVGGAFAFAALGALVTVAHEFRTAGSYSWMAAARAGRDAATAAFGA